MTNTLYPTTAQDVSDAIVAAASDGAKLQICGGGSKDAIGSPTPHATRLDMSQFSGVVDYDPPELVLTARAGTPLATIKSLLAAEEQMLAFDPLDHAAVLGDEAGAATIGGVISAGVSGPRRLSGGAARDHLLGFEAVSGHGEFFKAGAKVVKNVTGFDLSKVVTGSWGRLAAMTEVTLKVLPRPKTSMTLALLGLDPRKAVEAMSRAMGSPANVSAAAHLPGWRGSPATLFRLDGFPESVSARSAALTSLLSTFGEIEPLEMNTSERLWNDVRDVTLLPENTPLWRIITAPSRAAYLLESMIDAEWMMDWAGGLIWASTNQEPASLRSAVAAAGGHATLIRADQSMRLHTPTFHQQSSGLETLDSNIRRAFDPDGIFETGRF